MPLAPPTVCDAYLSRWPHQEGRFREYRNGAGFNHSHGFGGEVVAHVALPPKREAAERRVTTATRGIEEAQQRLETAKSLQQLAPADQSQAAEAVVKSAKRDVKNAEKAFTAADKDKKDLATTPDQIFKRDTTRENIATVLSLTVAMLVEWVLREYFGSTTMELRTFLEYFLYVPVEIRTRAHRVTYRFETRGLPPCEAERLRKACGEVTRRRLRRDGRLIIFEAVDSLAQLHGPDG